MTASSTPVRVPVGSLIAIGPPGCGKTTILRAALVAAGLPAHAVASRDDVRAKLACQQLACRAVPASCMHHEMQVSAHIDALATTFLAAGHPWLLDATNTHRGGLVEEVARAHRAGMAAVALRRRGTHRPDISVEECLTYNDTRARRVPHQVIAEMHARYAELSVAELFALGFDQVIEWDEHTTFELLPSGVDARGVRTDQIVVVGDLHGCATTFFDRFLPAVGTDATLSNPDVLVVSVGDINDKGADPQGSVALIRWWLWAVHTGRALLVDSNHNRKLVRHLAGSNVAMSPALAQTLAAIDAQPDADQLKADIVATFSKLPTYLWFDDLVVAHAGMLEELLGVTSGKARDVALYIREETRPWQWDGTATLVHGHEPVPAPATRRAAVDPNRSGHVPGPVWNIDTGAYLGGGLSAYVHSTGTTITIPTVGEDIAVNDPHYIARAA